MNDVMLLETTVSGPVAAGLKVWAFLLVEIRPYLELLLSHIHVCVCVVLRRLHPLIKWERVWSN